jgi:hypothetical protein
MLTASRIAHVPQQSDVPTKVDPNQHIKDYLDFYLSLTHPPRYAVLINGPWGIGKTHLIKRILKDWTGKDKKYIYLSLFGLATQDEIDAALLRSLYPQLTGKTTRLAGRAVKSALKVFKVNLDELKLDEFIDKFQGEVYVFDDLERCEMPINKVMGYINEFVEHDGCKVIVVANETEIDKQNGYDKRREKLIGKTLEVQSSFDEAFEYFCSLVDDVGAKTLLEAYASKISSIYAQSQLNNLRILQQTMWEFERLFCALSDKHRQNSAAMVAILGLLFTLSFELKAARISPEDLNSRNAMTAAMAEHAGHAPAGITLASRRYPEVDLYDTILSNDALSEALTKGIVNQKAIRSSLDKSHYFIDASDEPAWVTVWNYFDRTDVQFETALENMIKQFDNRQIVIPGELLHVFGLGLFLARIEVIENSTQEILAKGKHYIDDLYTQKRLEPTNESNEVRFGGWEGLGICEQDTKEYREFFDYLTKKQQQVVVDAYPEKSEILMKEMEKDPDLFLRRICFTQSEDNLYYRIPILAYIDPDIFVTALLAQHPGHQHTLLRALERRYEGGGLDRDLASERTWLTAVRDKLQARADDMTGIAKYRLLNAIKLNIVPLLDQGGKTDN